MSTSRTTVWLLVLLACGPPEPTGSPPPIVKTVPSPDYGPPPVEGTGPIIGAPLAPPASCEHSPGEVCNDQCWCWESPLPQGNDLRAAFAFAGGQRWALLRQPYPPGGAWELLAGKPQVVRFDSSPSAPPLPDDMEPLWMSGPGEIWGARRGGPKMPAILRWDGMALTEYPLEPGATQPRVFGPLEISGSGSTDVWALLQTISAFDVRFPVHWDGLQWSGDIGGSLPFPLYGLWARAPDDAWLRDEDFLNTLWQYDGTNWIRHVTSMVGSHVYGVVKGASWFMGWSTAALWDDVTWAIFETGLQDDPAGALNASWGASPDDIWSVGVRGTIIHWDGSSWRQVESNTSSDLYGVTGVARDDVWAVGDAGTVLHFDGSGWTMVSGGVGDVSDVWGTDDDDVWAVGREILHRSNKGWEIVLRPPLPLRAIWGSGASDVWAVGDGGLALHFDGTGWTATPVPSSASGKPVDLNSVWAAGPEDVWAVGIVPIDRLTETGAILHWDGSGWAVAAESSARFRVVRGSAANDVWASGEGPPLHWDGVAWHQVWAFPWADGLWIRSPQDVWAMTVFRPGGRIEHWNGTRATYWDVNAHGLLGPTASDSQDTAWAVGAGDGSDVLKFEDGLWRQSQTPSLRPLRSVWVSPSGTVYAVGDGGTILRRSAR